jgi:hypothetical protein
MVFNHGFDAAVAVGDGELGEDILRVGEIHTLKISHISAFRQDKFDKQNIIGRRRTPTSAGASK